MTFSEQVKQEIVNLTFNDNQLKALLSSFITNALSMSITNSQTVWELKSQSAQTIRFLTNNLSKLFGLKYQLSYTANSSKNQKRIYKLSIFDQFEVLTKQLELFNKPKKIISNETSKRAYLAGAFLSDGSISSLEKSQYHLELGSNNLEYLRILQSLLVKYHISMTLMKRKYDYCLYLKKSEAISDFLKVIGANEAMTQWEDQRISRDLNNQIHRLHNLDLSNLKKASDSGNNQVLKIKAIMASSHYAKQSKKFKLYCQVRLTNPDSSLNEIATIFHNQHQIKITKSGLNHYNIKIDQLYDLIK